MVNTVLTQTVIKQHVQVVLVLVYRIEQGRNSLGKACHATLDKTATVSLPFWQIGLQGYGGFQR
jgi:hypothetical protein